MPSKLCALDQQRDGAAEASPPPTQAPLEISIPQRNMACTTRQVWRKGDRLGVEFLSQGEPAGVEDGSGNVAKIRALEAEVAGLEAEIGVLKYPLHRREERCRGPGTPRASLRVGIGRAVDREA